MGKTKDKALIKRIRANPKVVLWRILVKLIKTNKSMAKEWRWTFSQILLKVRMIITLE